MVKQIIIISMFLILISPVSAYTYLNIYLDEKGGALFLGETNEQFSLPEGIEIKGNDIIGKTNSLTNKQGEIWTFSYFLDNAELNLILPNGVVIKNINGGEISVRKKQISIYNKNEIKVSYTIGTEHKFNYLFYLSIVLLGMFLIISFYFYKSRKKSYVEKLEDVNKLKIIQQTLGERENRIINKLKEIKEIKQSRLQKILEIPKASFSRHIQELEKKDLIKRIGEGKNKILSLK
jgi:uncharacterized membrane protein